MNTTFYEIVSRHLGTDTDGVLAPVARAISDEIAEIHDRRVTELLAHNNELLDRARKAEADATASRNAMLSVAIVAGGFARMLKEQKQ
jgi:hypothetical protein